LGVSSTSVKILNETLYYQTHRVAPSGFHVYEGRLL